MIGVMLGRGDGAIAITKLRFLIDRRANPDESKRRKRFSNICGRWPLSIWRIPDMGSHLSAYFAGSRPGCREIIIAVVSFPPHEQGVAESSIWVGRTLGDVNDLAALLARFPDQKFVHMALDGPAVASSITPLRSGANMARRAAYWCTRYVTAGVEAENRYREPQIRRARYDDLIVDPEAPLQGLCAFVAVENQLNMLESGGFKVPATTKNQHRKVNENLDRTRSSVRTELATRDVELFEYYTGDLLRYLGYGLGLTGRVQGRARLGYRWITARKPPRALINYFATQRRVIQDRFRAMHASLRIRMA